MVRYISVGAITNEQAYAKFSVSTGNRTYCLTEAQAILWRRGQFGFHSARYASVIPILNQLKRMKLIVQTDGSEKEEYRALSQCTIIPNENHCSRKFLSKQDKTTLTWIQDAGLILSIAELVFLAENGLTPSDQYLGKENTQALVKAIYTKNPVCDNILESQMENATVCNQTIHSVLNLLRKERIILL